MATIFKRGEVWWLDYRQDGKRVRVSLATTNRKVAEERRRQSEVQQELQRAQWAGLMAGMPAVAAAAVAVVESKPVADLVQVRADYEAWSRANKREKTILNDKGRLEAFFATVPGVALGDIRTAEVERFLTAEALKGRKPATLLRHREILRAFWRGRKGIRRSTAQPSCRTACRVGCQDDRR